MNDTDRQIRETLKNSGSYCCLNCDHACEGYERDQWFCSLFGRVQHEGGQHTFLGRLLTRSVNVCDLWEKRK